MYRKSFAVTTQFALTPLFATALFVLAVLAGYQYRKVWKTQGPAWKAWLYGTTAALCLFAVAFVPMQFS